MDLLVSVIQQFGDHLLIFKTGKPVQVIRLDFTDPDLPVVTEMAPLQRYAGMNAVAIFEEKLAILSGGCGPSH